jgi:hypothetical protein
MNFFDIRRFLKLEINKVLIGALQQCDTKELLENTFSRFDLFDSSQKTEHLIMAMGNPTVFFSDSNNHESRYETVLSMFLTGEWKMNGLYERAMLIKIEQLFCDYLWKKEFNAGLIDIQQKIDRIGRKLNN